MRELEAWGEFLISKVEGLGHSHTTISRAAKNQLCSMGHFQSRLPNGVLVPGLRQFNIVEKVLQDFRPQVRQTALVEYVLPRVVVGRTIRDRAKFLGVNEGTYNNRLQRLRVRVRAQAR